MNQQLISAGTMAQAVQFDPQFLLPRYPRFLTEVVAIPITNGLLFDGTDKLQALSGRATKVFLPRLLLLLDGTRSLEQLVEALPTIPARAIYNTLSLLYTRGLLEDNDVKPDLDPKHTNPQTLAFFRRYIDATRVNRNALEAQKRLQETEVFIYTSEANALETRTLLANLLRQTGISQIAFLSSDLSSLGEPEPPGKTPKKKLVVVFVEGKHDHLWLQALDNTCAAARIPWLLATVSTNEPLLELGPYVEHGETTCYHCFAKARQPENEILPPLTLARQHTLYVRMALDFLSVEITYLLSRIASPATGAAVMRYNLENWATQRVRYPKLQGCPHCRPLSNTSKTEILAQESASQPSTTWVDTASIYEDVVAFPSRHLLDPKTHQLHYRPDNIELTYQKKSYPGVHHIALPKFQEFPFALEETLKHLAGSHRAKPATALFDKARLAILLLLSAGLKSDGKDETHKLQRWSSTGGNLGSVEMYVIALHIAGLDSGIYFYEAFEHRLASLMYQNQTEEIRRFTQQIVPLTEQPDALLISTAAFHRISHKYGSFGYRICNLDAGFALGQLHLAGSSLGLRTQNVSDWADDLIEKQFHLEHFEEMITAVVAISGI